MDYMQDPQPPQSVAALGLRTFAADRTWGAITGAEKLAHAKAAYEAHCAKYGITPHQWEHVNAHWLRRTKAWHQIARTKWCFASTAATNPPLPNSPTLEPPAV